MSFLGIWKRGPMNKNIKRVGVFSLEDVLPNVFSKKIRYELRNNGFSYSSQEWSNACKKKYEVMINGNKELIEVRMGSHRYQLFLEKGTKCVECGIEGKYFGLERGIFDNPTTYHFNLYGVDEYEQEVLITKDHIVPRSKGGSNKTSNYQTMCSRCNLRKADKC